MECLPRLARAWVNSITQLVSRILPPSENGCSRRGAGVGGGCPTR
jgi:hypothetical protein